MIKADSGFPKPIFVEAVSQLIGKENPMESALEKFGSHVLAARVANTHNRFEEYMYSGLKRLRFL